MTEQIVRDLGKHLDQRIEQALIDFFERCDFMDCDSDAAHALALTVLGGHLGRGAVAMEATEPEYVRMCTWHWRQAFHLVRNKKRDVA